MFGINDEHDCNVFSMNSMNIQNTIDDCTSHDKNVSYKHVNFYGVHKVCEDMPYRDDRFCKKHKHDRNNFLLKVIDEFATKLCSLCPITCELCNKNSWFEVFILTDDIETNLKYIYMFCIVNCNENAYIANYRKMGKPIEYKRNTNERVKISNFPPIVSHDEIRDEEELPIQPISSIRSSKKLIKPTHDVVKKKKIRKSRGKKVSLPNDVAPIIVVPHEDESKLIVEDDTLDDDFVMPIACCDDYDWEDNDTSYDLENLYGTNLENYDDNCYTIGAIHTINDESDYAYDMQSHKLGDAMFDENDMFENLFAAINVCP